jgi:hypothetical protein
MEIKKNGQHSPGNPPPKAPEKTILGKEVQADSPKHPLGGGEEAWKEVGKNTKKTNKTPTASTSTVQDGEKSNLNAFGVLGDQEGDEIEEDSSAEGKSEREEKEEVKVTSPKQKSQKQIEAEAELREKNATLEKFKSLRKKLTAMQLWGKAETATVVEAYIAKVTILGYDVANDVLEELLGLERDNIKGEVESVTSGIERAEQKVDPKEYTVDPREVMVPNGETPQGSLEEKMIETPQVHQGLIEKKTNVGTTTAETPVAQGSGEQGSEETMGPSTRAVSPIGDSGISVDPRPPDPGTGGHSEVLNLSSATNAKITLLDFFPALPPK